MKLLPHLHKYLYIVFNSEPEIQNINICQKISIPTFQNKRESWKPEAAARSWGLLISRLQQEMFWATSVQIYHKYFRFSNAESI